MPDIEDDLDEIKLTLAVILSNQALILATFASFPGAPKSVVSALNKASDITMSKVRTIEQDIREAHGLKQSVS